MNDQDVSKETLLPAIQRIAAGMGTVDDAALFARALGLDWVATEEGNEDE
jgi:hypothetical protein